MQGQVEPQYVLRCGDDPGMALPRGRWEAAATSGLTPSLSLSPTPDMPRAASLRATHCDQCCHYMGTPSVASLSSEGRLPACQAWKEAM